MCLHPFLLASQRIHCRIMVMRHLLNVQTDMVEVAHTVAEDTGVKCMHALGQLYLRHKSLKTLSEVYQEFVVELSKANILGERKIRPIWRDGQAYWSAQLGGYVRGIRIIPTDEECEERDEGHWGSGRGFSLPTEKRE